jgi:superfamily II DNA or RNA helicase
MQRRILEHLDTHKIPYEFDYQVSTATPNHRFTATIPPREYQVGDTDTICAYRNGVIRLGTGYGKTVIACSVISKLNKKTLIIVPRTHLIDQFRKEVQKWFGFEPGIIQGNHCEVKDITIASIQTLVRRPAIAAEYSESFGCVIVDECHGSITDKQLEAIQTFNPEYLYGLTATPRRTDKQGDAIFFTFGDIIIDKDLERTAPKVNIVPYYGHIMLDEYANMIEQQTNDPERNKLIIEHVIREFKTGRKILVLTKRVAHYLLLSKTLRQSFVHADVDGLHVPRVYEISSEINVKDRIALLEKLRGGSDEFDVIFGTYSMLATGTDIPALDTLIFAGDLRSDVLQEQSAGRILRLFGDKQHPKIIDIADYGNKILMNQARERARFYSKMNWL